MDAIESRVSLPEGARPLNEYARYYTYENGGVVAEYWVPWKDDQLKDPKALAAGQSRWVSDRQGFPVVYEGGCSVVNVSFDLSRSTVKSVSCNQGVLCLLSTHCGHSAALPRSSMATIYMPLLNEGVDVLRPVEATFLSTDTYRVEGEIPDGEEWAFAPGTVVRCESKTFSGSGEGLVAVGTV